MKIKKTFDLKDDDDNRTFDLELQADEMYSFIKFFEEFLRTEKKYKTLSDEAEKELEIIRTKFYGMLEEYGIDLTL